jgi:hypothetical protein
MTDPTGRDEMQEPDLRDQLLADYLAHEDRIEKAANAELWELADWLAKYVPPRHPGPAGDTCLKAAISLEDLAARGHRSVGQLQRLRKIALATEVDRLPQITPRAYEEAMRKNGWDLMQANSSLVTKGHRLRDQAGKMESVPALKESLAKRTPEEKADVARELSSDPTVRELLGGEPIPDFGAAWADKLIVRVEETADKLTHLIRREGLVFSPDADLDWFLEALERAERQVADVRAAVQERVRDQKIGSVI